MNDDILAHHFDEVLNTLQEKDNFAIFTKAKPAKAPLVKKTLFKIVRPGDEQFRKAGSQSLRQSSRMDHMQYDASIDPYDSRPSSGAGRIPRIPQKNDDPPTANRNIKKIEERAVLRDKLGACSFCGRYFVGEYLNVHEKQCEKKNFGLLF